MASKAITARTMVELKAKLRKALGLPPRASSTKADLWLIDQRFSVSADYKRGVFVATHRFQGEGGER